MRSFIYFVIIFFFVIGCKSEEDKKIDVNPVLDSSKVKQEVIYDINDADVCPYSKYAVKNYFILRNISHSISLNNSGDSVAFSVTFKGVRLDSALYRNKIYGDTCFNFRLCMWEENNAFIDTLTSIQILCSMHNGFQDSIINKSSRIVYECFGPIVGVSDWGLKTDQYAKKSYIVDYLNNNVEKKWLFSNNQQLFIPIPKEKGIYDYTVIYEFLHNKTYELKETINVK